jgi:putative membrane-bound dehydrogenase-like protein
MIRAICAFSIAAIGVATWLLAVGGQPPRTGPATEKRFPPLQVPPGFQATLFACDPLVEYPSVIAAGPKPGALYVAVDYMTGLGSDGKIKSEIRLLEDTDGDGYADKATVVAGGFNSIQGLAYHDGTLFVMHAPFLTALRGGERKNLLTGLGLAPEDNPTRLHCANGVVAGHDGWLYLALGDNGVNVPRPEGDRLSHHGGGILRCRPDGRDLHLFATGLRNIYDIALDAELNVFTRDNENDGGTWMIRVYHSFFGADHGYPYHYEQRKDEAMPPIGDFGLGSSAGGLCYLETRFPPPYRGNLFFCEWGRSVVRYELHRSGSGFRPVKEIEFAAGDPKDTYPLKPTDLVVQRDGSLMVSDYADGQRPRRGRGRIYRIAYVGKGAAPVERPKAAGLDSDSYLERCDAQAALERSGRKPAFDKLGPCGRMHAVWALAKLAGDKAIEDLLRIAGSDPDPGVRVQAIRAIADLADPVLAKHELDAGRGDVALARRLAALADQREPRGLLEVVIALGRLRWADAPAWLRRSLDAPDAPLAHAAQQTLRRCGNWPAVLELLDEADKAPIRNIALRALAERYSPAVVDGLVERLRTDPDPAHRRAYADLLARIYKQPGPWKYWGYRPGPRPVNTVAWEKTAAIAKALDGVLADPDRSVRHAVLTDMRREKVPVSITTLGHWLRDEYQAERAAAILAALAEQPPRQARRHFQEVVRDRKHSAANRLTALDLYQKTGGGDGRELAALVPALEDGPVLAALLRRLSQHPRDMPAGLFERKLGSPDAEVRAAAIEALAEVRAPVQATELTSLLQDKDVRVRRAAAAAAGKLGAHSATGALLKLATEADVGVRRASLDALLRLREPRVVPLAVAALTEPALEVTALACLGELGGPDQLPAVLAFARRNRSSDGTISAVRTVTGWRDRKGTTEQQRQDLDRAAALIPGATGILARWRASDALDSAAVDKLRRSLIEEGVVPPTWRTLFGVGAEGHVHAGPRSGGAARSWFAATEVSVGEKMEVEFLASSRGSLSVWLNDRPIHRRPLPRQFQVDSDRFPGTLQKGSNRLLVELGPADGDNDFHLRFRLKSAKAEHEKLTRAALTRTGNAERGRKLFFDKEKSQCLKCHQLAGQGERIGPELTGVGARYSRIYLVESILEPSRTIAPSFETVVVTLANGKTHSGVKIAESDKTLTLADNQGQKHELAKADIEERYMSAVSTMPEGLEQRWSEEEFVDLIAFLASQKERTAK